MLRLPRERQFKMEALTIPTSPIISTADTGASSATTPIARLTGGYSLFPQTPGLGIGLATPSVHTSFITTPWESAEHKPGSSMDAQGGDYFSTGGYIPVNNGGTTPVQEIPETPNPEKEREERDSTLFSRWRPFGTKRVGRSASTDMGPKSPLSATEDKSPEQAVQEEPLDKPEPPEETLAGVVRKIRMMYDQDRDAPDGLVSSAITPSPPQETPVLEPPPNTIIIVQEDKPDSGGVADLYRGTVGCVGEDADVLEKVAPAWLGDLLLLNRVPCKDTVKVSFVLVPWEDHLPALPSESGGFVSVLDIHGLR